MKSAHVNTNTLILRLDRGDHIIESVELFAVHHSIANADIRGIGSVEEPLLAHYSIETKQFTEAHFEGIYEVTSLLGNIGLIDGKPVAHIHVTIADIDMNTHGGHLKAGSASATLEIIVTALESRFTKSPDHESGLNTWDFD